MTKLHSHLKKGFISILSLILILSNLNIINVNANETVTVAVKSQPYVNIILTTNKTNLDLTSFEKDVKAGLENKGIDTTNLEFQDIEQTSIATSSEDVNFAQAVNSWKSYGSKVWHANNNGQVYIDLTTGGMDFSSNWTPEQNYNSCKPGWYGEALINDVDTTLENISMKFTLVKGGTLLGGPCFNVTMEDDGSLSGYFFFISAHSGNCRLYKIDHYAIDDYFSHGANKLIWCSGANTTTDYSGIWYGDTKTNVSNGGNLNVGGTAIAYNAGINKNITSTITCLAEWERTTNLTNYDVSYNSNDGHIIIKKDNNIVANLYDKTYTSGTYGFWGNNCEQKESMYISNLQVTATKKIKKTYLELIQDVGKICQEGETNIIVDVDNSIDSSLNDPRVATWTNANGVQFLAWGSNDNKSHLNDFINKNNDGRGEWIDGSSYQSAINETINYISNLLNENISNENQYVIVGQDSTIDVTPSYFKTNAIKNGKGRWHITHNYTYYENNLGLSTQTEKDSPDLICNFDKPGEYIIQFDGEEVKRVYAHRLPIADFSITINGNSLILTSQSKDLDSNINNGYGNGIKSEKWFYKTLEDEIWTNGKLTTFDKNKIYLIKLEVEDFQGATSYTTKYVGIGNPVANFNLNSYDFSKYQSIGINDTSYDPEGYIITSWNWTLSKNGSTLTTSNEKNPYFDFKSLGTGDYKLTLEVSNNKGIKSSSYSRDFTVIDDTDAPTITSLSPTYCDWKTGTQTINFQLKDDDSGLKNWYYAITTTDSRPSTWSNAYTISNGSVTTPSLTGQYYLHILAYDNANNELYRSFNYYKIDNTKPTINNLTLSNDYSNITIDASDEGSGIDGYAITSTNVPPNSNEYQTSNVLKTYKSGTYYVWVKDKVGLVSDAKSITINRKENVTLSWNDNNNSNKLRPKNVTLTIFRNGSKLKDIVLDSTTTSYTFDNLDIMDSSGKLYSYTFNLNVNERYNVQVNGNTITASMKPTTFSVTIPKTISLNGRNGKCSYNIKVSGNLYLKDTLIVNPSSSFTLKDKNNISSLKGNITQTTTSFTKDNLGITNGNISLNKTKFAGTYNGNFNFNIKLNKSN